MKSFQRLLLAIIVVIAIGALLGIDAPKARSDLSNLEEYRFWLAVESAIAYFVAVGIGAIVARRSFVVPALALALISWSLIIHILYGIAAAAGPASYASIAKDNLIGLVLVTASGILGAILGRWFYKQEFERVADAS